MSEDQIDSGARVRLRTGGPLMAAGGWGKGPGIRGKIECSWFDANGKSQSDFFHPSQLVVVPDDDDEPPEMQIG